jgi:hypothetical protein
LAFLSSLKSDAKNFNDIFWSSEIRLTDTGHDSVFLAIYTSAFMAYFVFLDNITVKMFIYGGYILNGTPEEINMAIVVRLFDGAIGLLPCVTYEYYERCEECVDEETCGIRRVAMEIRNETVKRLKKATLANIIERETKKE